MTEEMLVGEEVRQHPAWARLNDQLEWYDHKSAVNQQRYKQIQAAQIILATSIPVFSLIGAASGQWITAILGASQFQSNDMLNMLRETDFCRALPSIA